MEYGIAATLAGRMSSRLPASNSAIPAARRQRRIRRRRQITLLAVAGLLGVILIIWAVAGGSGRGSRVPVGAARIGTPSAAASTGATPGAAASTAGTTATPGPAPVTAIEPRPDVTPRWSNPEPWTGAPPAVLVTSLITDPQGDVATIAWFRSHRTQLALYPGTGNPGPTAASRGPEEVPLTARRNLVATFNSGFYEKDGAAGFYVHGTLYHPMLSGLATVVAYASGKIDIIRWTGGRRPGPGIVMARQNLPLLVSGGNVSPHADILSDWGITWHGGLAVWRSAIGVDRNGNLIYAAGPAQTVSSIARVMVHAGAVRAMQLDINPEWPILVTFGRPDAGRPTLATPNPNQIPTRFLYPSLKDFFAIYLRTTPGVQPQPW
jgi:hypothetical protein